MSAGLSLSGLAEYGRPLQYRGQTQWLALTSSIFCSFTACVTIMYAYIHLVHGQSSLDLSHLNSSLRSSTETEFKPKRQPRWSSSISDGRIQTERFGPNECRCRSINRCGSANKGLCLTEVHHMFQDTRLYESSNNCSCGQRKAGFCPSMDQKSTTRPATPSLTCDHPLSCHLGCPSFGARGAA
jgi:hypothetical protein